jgi:hypothetical protein
MGHYNLALGSWECYRHKNHMSLDMGIPQMSQADMVDTHCYHWSIVNLVDMVENRNLLRFLYQEPA